MKAGEEIKQFRDLSVEDLAARVATLRHEAMNLNFRHSSRQLASSAQLRHTRKSIARALTILNEKKRGENKKGA